MEGSGRDVMEGATDEEDNREHSRAVRDNVAAGQAPTLVCLGPFGRTPELHLMLSTIFASFMEQSASSEAASYAAAHEILAVYETRKSITVLTTGRPFSVS